MLSPIELSDIRTRLRQPRARLGCGAAIIADDRLLLVKRRRDPEADHWGLPGGKVERNETIDSAVLREIAEEIGVELTLERLLCVTEFSNNASGDLWIAPVFLAAIRAGTPRILELDALAEMAWFACSKLPAPLTQATVQAVAALRR